MIQRIVLSCIALLSSVTVFAEQVDWKTQQRINDQIAEGNWGKWFQSVYYHNTTQRWIETFIIILACIFVGKLAYITIGKGIKKVTSRTKTKLDDLLVDMLEEPIVALIIITGIWYACGRLIFSEGAQTFLHHVFVISYTLNITWMIARTVDALIKTYIVPKVEKSESSIDDQMMPIVRKGLKAVIWIMGIIMGLNNAGFDVAALIAGLGIGGLALALAAQDTVKNIFGGIMIFLDKPFKIGDRVIMNGFEGNITEIGIRSTRLTTPEGRSVSMPNHFFSESAIMNITAEPSRRVPVNLALNYDTNETDIRKAQEILRSIVASNEKLEKDMVASLTSFGDFALNISFVYFIKSGEDNFVIMNDVHLEVLKQFNQAGLKFAFPTRTIINKETH